MLICLNGPPKSGKDTLAKYIRESHKYAGGSFKTKLIEIALCISQISYFDWDTRYEDRSLKEEPWQRLGGLSQREYLIKISEDWVKPVQGSRYLGDVLAHRIKYNFEGLDVVLSDSGFPDELKPLLELEHDILIVHLHRYGCSFEGDSRGYLPHGLAPIVVVHNDGTVQEAAEQIMKAVQRFS